MISVGQGHFLFDSCRDSCRKTVMVLEMYMMRVSEKVS